MQSLARARALRLRTLVRPPARFYATPVEFKQPSADPQLEDYPILPPSAFQRRPPTGWWDNQSRRNFEETLHEQDEVLDMTSPDVSNVSNSTALRHFAIATISFVALFSLLNVVKPERPAVPRSYPYDGLNAELGGLEQNKAIPESEEDAE